MNVQTPGARDLDPGASYRGASSGAGLPGHAPPTYYDRPLLKKPHWEWEVVTYLFMGGIMGGSGILAALASDRDDAELARSARYVSFVLAATCPAVLIKHLGRPERFGHMLRIVKFRSVMSMGVWGLVAFSLPATAGAAAQASRDELLPTSLRWLRAVAPPFVTDPLSALLGAFIGGYTGVLISATAIPFWAIGKRYIPAFSVASGIAGACAANGALLALSGADERTAARLERLELAASLVELGLLLRFRAFAGDLGKPMFDGRRGAKLQRFTIFGGIVIPSLLHAFPLRARWKTLLASTLTLVGGYVLRESLIEAGKASAGDPRAAFRQPE